MMHQFPTFDVDIYLRSDILWRDDEISRNLRVSQKETELRPRFRAVDISEMSLVSSLAPHFPPEFGVFGLDW